MNETKNTPSKGLSEEDFEELLKEIAEDNNSIESLEEDYALDHGDNDGKNIAENLPQSESAGTLDSEKVSKLIRSDEDAESVKRAVDKYNYLVTHVQPLANKAKREKARIKKLSLIDLRRRLLMATDLPFNIYESVTSKELQELIKLLTEDIWHASEYYRSFINRRFATYLRTLMPADVRRVKKLHPEVLMPHPGFLYKTATPYGNGLEIWVRPDIPYFFPQFSETKVLQDAGFDLTSIDKAIVRFFRLRRDMAVKEVEYATKLRRCQTYNDIIKINPRWLIKLKPEVSKYILE